MKMTATSSSGTGLTSVTLEHGGRTSVWDVSGTYAKTSVGRGAGVDDEIDTEALFAEINGYWATLSPERQQGIWDVFEDIRQIFEADYELRTAIKQLRQKVAQLYQFMPMAELQHYLNFHAEIDYPSSVHEKFNPNSTVTRADSTYLKQDYFGLVALSVALRPMIPIWGSFIDISKRDVGNNYKEYQAYGLLYNTHLARSAEVARLREFIEAKVTAQTTGDKNFTTVMGGLGTVEMPGFLTAQICVRRLAVSTVTGHGDRVNLIAKAHFFVDSKMKSLDRDFGRRFGGKISEKKLTGGAADDNNTSVVEMFKIKPDLSDGEIVILNVYAEDPWRMAAVRCPDLPPDYLRATLESVDKLDQVDISPHQTWLVKWIIHPIIPAKGVDLLTIDPLKNCLAVTQAVLWHWGYYDLAAMVTAIPQLHGDDIMIGATESRQRIQKEQLQKMQERYPYALPAKRGAPIRQTNVAARAVDRLADLLTRNDWTLTGPPALLEKTSRVGTSRTLTAPPDLKIQLANLIEHPQFAK